MGNGKRNGGRERVSGGGTHGNGLTEEEEAEVRRKRKWNEICRRFFTKEEDFAKDYFHQEDDDV